MSQITQKGAYGPLALQANGSFQTSTSADLSTLVGTRYDLSDGREVILVSTGSTTTATAGQLYQDAALVSGHQNVSVTSVTAYSTNGNIPASLSIGTNATAATANQYAGGFVVVNAGTGKGQTLRIASNSVFGATTTSTITLEDGPNVALSTSDSKVCLIPPHGANVIQMPTTPTGAVVGVALAPIAAGAYGFLTSKGLTSALSDASVPTIGMAISPSTTTAGAITAAIATNAGTNPTSVIGYASQTGVSAECRTVFLNV